MQPLSSHSDSFHSEDQESENYSFDAAKPKTLAGVDEHRPGYVANPVGRHLAFRTTKIQMEAKKTSKRIFIDLEP